MYTGNTVPVLPCCVAFSGCFGRVMNLVPLFVFAPAFLPGCSSVLVGVIDVECSCLLVEIGEDGCCLVWLVLQQPENCMQPKTSQPHRVDFQRQEASYDTAAVNRLLQYMLLLYPTADCCCMYCCTPYLAQVRKPVTLQKGKH